MVERERDEAVSTDFARVVGLRPRSASRARVGAGLSMDDENGAARDAQATERALLRLKQIARILDRPLGDFFPPFDGERAAAGPGREETPSGEGGEGP